VITAMLLKPADGMSLRALPCLGAGRMDEAFASLAPSYSLGVFAAKREGGAAGLRVGRPAKASQIPFPVRRGVAGGLPLPPVARALIAHSAPVSLLRRAAPGAAFSFRGRGG
jgi:hypothetical protein